MHDSGNTRCIVWSIRLKLSGAERLLECLLLVHQLIDRIRLVSICHDRLVAKYTNRCINDQTWILKLARIKCLCTDSLSVLYKHTITAVRAASHDKIRSHCLLAILCASDHDSSSRVSCCAKFLTKSYFLHLNSPSTIHFLM